MFYVYMVTQNVFVHEFYQELKEFDTSKVFTLLQTFFIYALFVLPLDQNRHSQI